MQPERPEEESARFAGHAKVKGSGRMVPHLAGQANGRQLFTHLFRNAAAGATIVRSVERK
jgi:hypothetical protein